MIWAFVATIIIVYVVIVWLVNRDSPPTDAHVEWRKAAQGRVRTIEKRYMD